MTRLFGAVLVIAGCGALGLAGVARLAGRVRDLGELAAGLDVLQRELGWRLAPLPQALEAAAKAAHGPAAQFFARSAREWGSQMDRHSSRCGGIVCQLFPFA